MLNKASPEVVGEGEGEGEGLAPQATDATRASGALVQLLEIVDQLSDTHLLQSVLDPHDVLTALVHAGRRPTVALDSELTL